jgi:hypothetical protein
MPIVQSAYTRYMPVAQVGMPASMHGWDIDTKLVETVAGIGFGLVVSKGSADNGIIIGGAAAVGVTVRDIALSQVPGNLAADLYARYANAGIMVVGDIWAIALNGSTANTGVLYDPVTGDLGKTAGTALAGAIWMTTASAGGLAIARLNK